MDTKNWYRITNIAEVDTPALVVYSERVKQNISSLVTSIDDVSRLRPHCKTHKSSEITTWMLQAGITKFKCATIAEAEMLASAGVRDVVLAYQPIGPKVNRYILLVKQFPLTKFSCLVDNIRSAQEIATAFHDQKHIAEVYIDLNVGMNRTGIIPEKALAFFEECQSYEGITIVGLHAYDGHIRDTDSMLRSQKCDHAFSRVDDLKKQIQKHHNQSLTIIAGGTPTYSIHCKRKEIECSPGTFIYWDKGYEQLLPEQHYLFGALVVSRVISKPTDDIICIDLGHKSIASENPITNRVYFLDEPTLEPVGHSEEHMVLKTNSKDYNIGDVLYGIPHHICPTVALYDRVAVVENQHVVEYWKTLSRNRKITI
jgi:D-serine deaminase-like pyridoxal phosphate-dependent protein